MKIVFVLLAVALVGLSRSSPLPKEKIPRTHGNFGPKIKQTFEIKPKALFQPNLVNNDPIEIAKLHIALHNKIDLSTIRVASSNKNDKIGVTHVYLQQVVNGLDVINAVANVNVNADGKIVSAGNGIYRNAAPAADFVKSVKLSAADAVSALANFLKLGTPTHLVTDKKSGYIVVSGAPFALSGIPAELKYIQVEDGSKVSLVWDLRVEMKDNMYNAFVDTTTGEVVSLIDWVSDAAYNAYPLGINDPISGDRKLDINPAHSVASPLGWHRQGEGEEEYTNTIGNNVFAQTNPDGGNDYIDNYRPDGGANHIFDFPLDITKEPAEYIDASIANLFYLNNIFHDLLYVHGFDEKSGNFQQDNFGRGGVGNDAVVAFAQDGSGTNNANFMTPPDGGNGRMRMYIWTQTDPDTDSDFDSGVMIHEYFHGVSTRLTGGPTNVGCVPWEESGGMGEGWGDWVATIIRTTSSSTRDDNFAIGAYLWGVPNGFRIFVHSTNMETNPLTYGILARPEFAEVHNIGEVWAVTLYEVFWNLVDKHGFDPDWYNADSTGGNVKMLRLVLDGMKLQPCYPTFVDARDAIIQADELNNNGENFCELWKGFAKRGLGINAVGGGHDWEWEGVEDFEIPEECV